MVTVEGRRRCRVYYCDPMRSDQKAEAEKNHEELRRVLPKGRSNFDALTTLGIIEYYEIYYEVAAYLR